MNVVDIPISRICQGERKRPVDQKRVKDIAQSIEREGLYHPIGLIPCACNAYEEDHYRLIFGAHRVAAVLMLEQDTIPVSLLEEGLANEEYQLIELEENSARKDLTGAQRKKYAAEIGRLLSVLHNGSDFPNRKHNWLEEIGKRLGMVTSTVYEWWQQFCKEASKIDQRGRKLVPSKAEETDKQQFFDWLEEQKRQNDEEKVLKEAEAAERRKQETLSEARDELRELIADYGEETVWDDVVYVVMGEWLDTPHDAHEDA